MVIAHAGVQVQGGRGVVQFAAAAGAISTTLAGSYVEISFLDLQIQNGQKIFISLTTLAANTTLNVRASVGEFA